MEWNRLVFRGEMAGHFVTVSSPLGPPPGAVVHIRRPGALRLHPSPDASLWRVLGLARLGRAVRIEVGLDS